MFDFFAIALFQLATVFGYAPTAQPNANNATSPQTEADGMVGSGGWGNDITANAAVGSGGWGNDITANAAVGSGGWGNDIIAE